MVQTLGKPFLVPHLSAEIQLPRGLLPTPVAAEIPKEQVQYPREGEVWIVLQCLAGYGLGQIALGTKPSWQKMFPTQWLCLNCLEVPATACPEALAMNYPCGFHWASGGFFFTAIEIWEQKGNKKTGMCPGFTENKWPKHTAERKTVLAIQFRCNMWHFHGKKSSRICPQSSFSAWFHHLGCTILQS